VGKSLIELGQIWAASKILSNLLGRKVSFKEAYALAMLVNFVGSWLEHGRESAAVFRQRLDEVDKIARLEKLAKEVHEQNVARTAANN